MKKIILSIAFLLICNWIIACSCIGTSTVKSSLKGNDVIFLGKVTTVEVIKTPWIIEGLRKMTGKSDTVDYLHSYKFTFEIIKPYKGLSSQTIEIHTGVGHGDCGYPFEKGNKYIVYANWNNNLYKEVETVETILLETNICTRTTSEYEKEVELIENFSKIERKRLFRQGKQERRKFKRLIKKVDRKKLKNQEEGN